MADQFAESDAILGEAAPPQEPGILGAIKEDVQKSIRAASMVLGAYKASSYIEKRDLLNHFTSDVAMLGAGVLTGELMNPLTGRLVARGATPAVKAAAAILRGAAEGATSMGARAGVRGEDVTAAMVGGAVFGGATGAVFHGIGSVVDMGKKGALAAEQDKILLSRKSKMVEGLKKHFGPTGPKLGLGEEQLGKPYTSPALVQHEAEIRLQMRSLESHRIQSDLDDALAKSTSQINFEGDVPVTIEQGTFPGQKTGVRITVAPKGGTPEQRAAAHEVAKNMMLGAGRRPEELFRKTRAEMSEMTAGLPGKPMLDQETAATLQKAFKDFLAEGGSIHPRLPKGSARGGRRPSYLSRDINNLVTEFIGEDPAPRGIAVAQAAAKNAMMKLPYGDRAIGLFSDAATLIKRTVVASGDVLSGMGPVGARMGQMASDVTDRGMQRAAADVLDLEKLTKGMSNKERYNIAHSLHGDDVPMNENVKAAVTKLRSMLEVVGDAAKESGILVFDPSTGKVRPFDLRRDYFPLTYSEKTVAKYLTEGTPEREQALQMLLKQNEGLSRKEAANLLKRQLSNHLSAFNYGHLQMTRSMGLPGWEEDVLKVLPQYFMSAWKRIETAKAFGPNHELAEKMIQQLKGEGQNHELAARIYRAFTDSEPIHLRELARTTRSFNIMSLLSTSGLVQFSQHANTIAYTGYKNYLQGLATYFTRNPAAREMAAKSGAYMQEMMQDLVPYGDRGLTSKFVSAIGLSPLDKANRIIAALSGMKHADDIAAKFVWLEGKKTEQWMRDLTRMGLNPEEVIAQKGILTPEQRLIAGQKISNATQFRGSVLDLPIEKHTTWGQFIYLFKTFSLQQGRFIGSLMAEGKQGNWAPMLRYLAATGTLSAGVGDAVQTARGLIRGQEPERAEGVLGYIEDAAIGGAFGIASDMYTAMAKGPDFVTSLLLGPTFKGGVDLLGDIKAAAPSSIGGGDNPKKILHDSIRHIPLFGRRLADYWVPLD